MNEQRCFARVPARLAVAAGLALALAACQEGATIEDARAYHPIPQATLDLMAKQSATEMSPVLIRTFKKEAEFEIWKMTSSGRYAYIKTFPMCRWSGQLGPKTREGDRQVPEGFYSIAPGQMNPNSHYYLSFNVGYPNSYDRAHGDTGDDIMVHGICSSAGCFSMTNQQIDEIYAIAREAFAGGQREIQMESFPFHMTAANMAKFRLDPNMPFWKQLKRGSDYFKVAGRPPDVGVCGRHYVFDKVPAAGGRLNPMEPCPALKDENPSVTAAVTSMERQDNLQVAALVAQGVPAIRLVYQDGGQNPAFADRVADVSRPQALAQGPTVIALGPNGKPLTQSKTLVASATQKRARGSRTRSVVMATAAPRRTSSRPATLALSPVAVALAAPAPSAASAPVAQKATTPFYKHWLSLVSDKLAPMGPADRTATQQAPTP